MKYNHHLQHAVAAREAVHSTSCSVSKLLTVGKLMHHLLPCTDRDLAVVCQNHLTANTMEHRTHISGQSIRLKMVLITIDLGCTV